MRIARPQRLIAAMAATLLFAPTAVSAHHRPDHAMPPGQAKKLPITEPTETPAPPPADYTAITGLSQPVYPQTTRESFRVPMHDGVELYVEVVRPDPQAYPTEDGRWPVILEASPYHGTLADRDGIRIFPDPRDAGGKPIGMTGYFAPRGYAVVMADLRGTGRSSGCLDHLGPDDARDLKTIVEWAASQPWSNGRVGMTGHSYVGSTPSVAAAQRPEGLVTIVPSAGLVSMYDHQFQKGVPWLLQWVGPQAAYPTLSTQRHLPPGVPGPLGGAGGDYFGQEPQTAACGWQESALTAGHGQVTGQYQEWHAERDWREAAAGIDIPVFMVHGVKDNAARIPAADWLFADRGTDGDDKVWIGQWDHGASNGATICAEADRATGHVNCRFEEWQYALHAWFDKHLQQRDVDTGPPVEAFLNGDRVWTANGWQDAQDRLELTSSGDGTLTGEAAATPGEHAYTSYAFQSVVTIGGQPRPQHSQEIVFTSEPVAEQTLLAGSPSVRLRASVSNPNGTHLIATVYRQAADGSREAMTYCAIQPQFRDGVDNPKPVVPGEAMDLEPSCFTMAHVLNAGERVVLGVGAWSPHHVSSFAQDARVTVFSGPGATSVDLPARPGATVYDDTAR